jgi:hypothetical protein
VTDDIEMLSCSISPIPDRRSSSCAERSIGR